MEWAQPGPQLLIACYHQASVTSCSISNYATPPAMVCVGGHHIMQAFQHGYCSHLKTLSLDSALDDEQGVGLRMTFSSGALPQLEELIVSYCRMKDGGMAYVMDGLASGRCNNLKVLKLMICRMGCRGGEALARALASGSLPRLRELEFIGGDGFGIGGVMAQVIRGLASKCLSGDGGRGSVLLMTTTATRIVKFY